MPEAPGTFAHLHQHTAYSLLDGAARIQDLVAWVKQVTPDQPVVAMTDHGNMHGAVEFYRTAVASGVKPIIGLEAYVTAGSRFERRRPDRKLDGGYFHLTLLAKDMTGYRNLSKLNSRAWLEGFYMKPRVDHELLREHSEGIVALSGCLGAQIPRAVLDLGEAAGEEVLRQYLDIFGDDFFIEIQDHGLDQQKRLNPVLKGFADRFGLGLVATNDGHYVRREDATAHEALLAIQTKTTLSDPDRFRFPCDEFYVKTPAEMAAAVPEEAYPSALANTMAVAELCNLELPIGDARVYQMPELPIPEGRTLNDQLRVQSYEGLAQRYPDAIDEDLFRRYLAAAETNGGTHGVDPERAPLGEVLLALARCGEAGRSAKREDQNFDTYRYPHLGALRASGAESERALRILGRVEYELGVIIAMGFPDYFLIVADFINWAKDQGIAVGPGRGSGAGSIVAYAVRVTDIDPLEFDLLFERFLNPERISMPDFDVDFSDVRRGEVIEYVRRKYGEDKVAHIATFGTMASKAAIKDAARVTEASFAEADRVSKLVPVVFGRSVSIERALEEVPEFRELYDGGAKAYVDIAQSLEGLTRHASVHAAGVIISRDPVQELAPVFRSGDGPIVCQYDMGSIEDLGFLKMDFLGLRTLSFIEAAVRIVEDTRGVALDPSRFPHDDAATFELLSRGEAAGVFQFESGGMVDTLKKLKPRRIQDLIAVSALYRPGPMENIPTYIRRHHGVEQVRYDDFETSEALLRPILEETYGIPVYQEQIMQIAQAVAGYSLGEADLLRRVMGKKKVAEMERQRNIFESGAGQKGIPAPEANRIFDLLEKFANYGFNKCLTGDTEVVASGGRVRSIAEMFERQEESSVVSSTERFELVQRPVTAVVDNGERPVLRLLTSLGKEIVATGNHPFRTFGGWTNLEELKAGDRLAAPGVLPVEGCSAWPRHELVLLGWILCEAASCHRHGPYLCSSNENVVADMVAAAERFDDTSPSVARPEPGADGFTVYLGTGTGASASGGRSGVQLWLERLGQLGRGAADRSFPPAAFELTNDSLAVVLGRYWSGDGFLSGSGGDRAPFAATSSAVLAKQLQHLLLRLGIVSRVAKKGLGHRDGRSGCTVQLLGRRSIEAFLTRIAPHMVEQDEQIARLHDCLAAIAHGHDSLDTIPAEVKDLVDQVRREHGLSWRQLEQQSGVRLVELYGPPKSHENGVRRSTIRTLADLLGSSRLRAAASDEVFWETVVGTQPAGTARTYDLEIQGEHNFVANDLIVHNSHSAAYGELSFQTAYLKAHYPVEFAAALLTVERANSDKVAQYVADARHMGIEVLPPDINESRGDFTPVGEVVRFGLHGVKNVGDAAVGHIIAERERGGAYKDLFDFSGRVDAALVNKRALEHLVKAGAFDAFGERGALLANLDAATKWGSAQRESQAAGQMTLFAAEDLRPPTFEPREPLGELDRLRLEKEALGLYISAHPMRSYPGLAEAASCPVDATEAYLEQERSNGSSSGRVRMALAGIVQNVAKRPTRKGTMMARFEIADESGSREVVAFNRVFDEIAGLLEEDAPVVLVADASEDGDAVRLVADRLIRWDARAGVPEVVVLRFDPREIGEHQLLELRALLDETAGATPVQLRFPSERGVITWATEGVQVDADRLAEIEGHCPWLRTSVTVDRARLLADRGQTWSRPAPAAAADVPF